MSNKKNIRICPYCGNNTMHEILFFHTEKDGETILLHNNEMKYDTYNLLAQCQTCEQISYYTGWEMDESFEEYSLKYPLQKNLANAIPKKIKECYEEARKVKKISSSAYAILIRKALELLCEDKKAKGNNLQKKINHLAQSGTIPSVLVDMADALRFFGNQGAHEAQHKFNEEDLEIMDDFFIAVVEYVYVAPSKVENFKKALRKKKK